MKTRVQKSIELMERYEQMFANLVLFEKEQGQSTGEFQQRAEAFRDTAALIRELSGEEA